MKTKIIVFVIFNFVLMTANCIDSKTNQEVKSDSLASNIKSIAPVPVYKPTHNEEAAANYNKGNDFSDKENYNMAVMCYQKAIELDSNYVDAYDNLGVTYRRLGKYNEALMCYNKSMSIYPEGVLAHQNAAVIYNIQKQYDKAITEYEKIIDLQPTDPEGYFGLSNMYLVKNSLDLGLQYGLKAEELYKKNNSPYIGDAQLVIGMIYYYKNEKKEAKQYLTKAIAAGNQVDKKVLDELNIK